MFERLSNMNRGVFFLIVVLLFLVIGMLFGLSATLVLCLFTNIRGDEEVLIACLFGPPGVCTGVGLVVAFMAASFYKPVDSRPSDIPRQPSSFVEAKPPKQVY